MLRKSDVMTRDAFTLAASTPAETAARELIVRGFTGAPVRDARGLRVAGGAGVDVDLSMAGARAARAESSFRPHMRGDWS